MHIFKAGSGYKRFATSVVSYSAFHSLREGVRSFNAGQFAVLMALIMFDAWFFASAWFAWHMMLPIATLGTLPFVLLTGIIIARLIGKI